MRPHFPTPSWSNRLRLVSEDTEVTGSEVPQWLLERFVFVEQAEREETGKQAQAPPLPDVFVPENYEPNYAYPLIVWLTDPAHSEEQLLELTRQLSPQNYLATVLPGCGLTEHSFYSLTGIVRFPIEELAGLVYSQVKWLRRLLHVHTERVYVAGCDLSGRLALELLLHRPDWFGGALAFGEVGAPEGASLSHYHQLRGKRVFLAADLRSPRRSLQLFLRTSRLLHAGGLDVQARIYEAEQSLTKEMLADADRWLIEGILAADTI